MIILYNKYINIYRSCYNKNHGIESAGVIDSLHHEIIDGGLYMYRCYDSTLYWCDALKPPFRYYMKVLEL